MMPEGAATVSAGEGQLTVVEASVEGVMVTQDEAAAAHLAHVVPRPSVPNHVLTECGGITEGPGAAGAGVGPLATVHTKVTPE